jgi:hypothetical protein
MPSGYLGAERSAAVRKFEGDMSRVGPRIFSFLKSMLANELGRCLEEVVAVRIIMPRTLLHACSQTVVSLLYCSRYRAHHRHNDSSQSLIAVS